MKRVIYQENRDCIFRFYVKGLSQQDYVQSAMFPHKRKKNVGCLDYSETIELLRFRYGWTFKIMWNLISVRRENQSQRNKNDHRLPERAGKG